MSIATRARTEKPLYFELPFPPSVNSIWRAGKGGRHFLAPAYKAWLQEAQIAVKLQARSARIDGPFAVQMHLVRPDRRRRDLDNALKVVLDLLHRMNVTDDDSECQQIEARWVQKGPPLWIAVRPCSRWGEPRHVEGAHHEDHVI